MDLTFGTLCGGVFLLIILFLGYVVATGSHTLRNYVITRTLLIIPMVWILITTVFLLMRVLPGDPIASRLKPGEDPERIAELRARAGLDKPIYEQYWIYLTGIVQGDLGTSENIESDTPVLEIIGRRLPATIELVVPAILVMLIFGVFSGAFSAHRRKSAADYGLRLTSVVFYAIPIFWMGLMLQIIFARELGWLPVANRVDGQFSFEKHTNLYLLDTAIEGNWDAFWSVAEHMILPSLTLAMVLTGVFIRLTRSNMVEILQEDYVTASRARGVPENRVVYVHALRNSFIPIMTLIGLQVAVLLAGAVLTETTFSWDGLGKLLRDGIAERDYPVVQGTVTIFAIIVGITSTLTDILYAFIDPRIRY